MRRLDTLLLLMLLLASFDRAQAQTCTSTTPAWSITSLGLSANSIAPTGALNIAVGFTSVAQVNGVTLDIEIHDPTGARVAQDWVTGQDFGACQNIIVGPWVYQAPAGAPTGTYTIALGVFAADGSNPYFNAAAATFTVQSPVVLPPCLPKVQWPLSEAHSALPAGVSVRYTTSTTYVCQFPTGYATYANLFTPDQSLLSLIWSYVSGSWTLAQAQADCTQTCVAPTDSEQAYLNTLIAKYRPRALVAFNGANKTRSIYKTNSDGTLNTQAIAGKSIAVGTPCDETNRIPPPAGISSGYYSVAGQPDQAGSAFLPGIYAFCVVSLPIGAN